MRLKTKLVLAITSLVFLVAAVLSWLYLGELLRDRIEQSYAANDMVAHQVQFGIRQALELGLRNSPVNVNDPVALRQAVAETLRKDEGLNALMDSVIRYSPTVFDVAIDDSNGQVMESTDPTQIDHARPHRSSYKSLRDSSPFTLLNAVMGPPRVYDVALPLERNGQPFATIRVGIRTTFLRASFQPWFVAALSFTGLALLTALLVAAFLSNLALRPLVEIGERLDALDHSGAPLELEAPRKTDAIQVVSNKIDRIGRKMRNVEEVFSALKENLDHILSNLQDGLLLFTGDGHAVLVSDAVERYLGMPRAEILGATVQEIFDRNTILGHTIREAFDGRLALVQEEVETEAGRRLEVSLDFIHDDRNDSGSLGALVTLHDLESVREIERELEISRRMSAIGRLTSGVGHEVKNPINAIVVHLELLKNKLQSPDRNAQRHFDVIESEIHRLDRVVQTLVDFSRPVELQLKEQDLRNLVEDVLTLASAELETRNIVVERALPAFPMPAKVDSDLLKQALLNVVLNGAQAMNEGGRLQVSMTEEARMAIIRVRDEGVGIAENLREKIFDLYFTTKNEGSGIGLAMTYRILQLHNGGVEVESEVGRGSEFILRLPLSYASDSRARGLLRQG